MLAEVRSPLPALIVAASCLLESGCLVTVFVKDAASEDTAATEDSGSGPTTQLTQGTATEGDDEATSSETGSPEAPSVTTGATIYDVGEDGEWVYCPALREPCDGDNDDIDHALGLNCARGMQTEGALTWSGPEGSRLVLAEPLGETSVFAPTEGARRVLLSTGDANHVLLTIDELPDLGDCPITQTCPSRDAPGHDLPTLPPPLEPSPQQCSPNHAPQGPGDCSGTVLAQWALGGEPLVAYDYTELRFSAVAPAGTAGFSFDFAFLTAEYPARFPGNYNDLFVAWVSSERYTGNVALDPDGNPIAAVTLPYEIKFDPTPMDCGDECPDVPLRGFAFEGHAGTAWHAAEVPVAAGETIEVVFALFDVGDATVDSAVLLDGVRWLCAPPTSSI
jgi:hypothetical protein